MNNEYLQQRLTELSELANVIYSISRSGTVDVLANHLTTALDEIVVRLRLEDEGECRECGCVSHESCPGRPFHD